MGLMVIDQSAANIAPAVITNTNTKLVFRQEDGKEIETIGKAIGLKSDEWNDLQLLEKGEYLLRNSRFPRPIKMAPLTDMELPKRKALRLPEYDYSAPGAYFITICTQDRKCILSDIAVGALHEAPAVSV